MAGKVILTERDNVAVDLATGHKCALRRISRGETVYKYGYPIGIATETIAEGEAVHTHNLRTGLSGLLTYRWEPSFRPLSALPHMTFDGYLRPNGTVGIRNEIWIVPTVGCVNGVAKTLAARTGAIALTHPFGCSQLGGDLEITQKILRGLCEHPNAGGVLVLGLGCENNGIARFREVLGEQLPERIRFLNCQDTEDELERGCELIAQLRRYADGFSRRPCDLSALRVGLKCGGSDGYSGLTANPLVGRFSDALIARGGSTVMTEVPEMFGAETILMDRCTTRETFERLVGTINGYKAYFQRHGQPIYENPSPGNKAGGITTLEEKSLGCITKGGSAPVEAVLDYGDTVTASGLNLLNGPGNDIVACTNLAAVGCQMILFTTGRGTPLGAPIPTMKIATNSALAAKKANWIDFDAGGILNGEDLDDRFFRAVLSVANGAETKNEINGAREISIFKDGVIL